MEQMGLRVELGVSEMPGPLAPSARDPVQSPCRCDSPGSFFRGH